MASESLPPDNLLKENLKLLQSLSESLTLSLDNAPDLHACLMDSPNYMNQLISEGCNFLFEEASATDLHTADIAIDTSSEESSSWALFFTVLTQALGGTSKMGKIFHAGTTLYSFSTWGLALLGLYRTGAVVRVAVIGVRTSSKYILKALCEDGFTTLLSSEG